jgi:hypothetical protein
VTSIEISTYRANSSGGHAIVFLASPGKALTRYCFSCSDFLYQEASPSKSMAGGLSCLPSHAKLIDSSSKRPADENRLPTRIFIAAVISAGNRRVRVVAGSEDQPLTVKFGFRVFRVSGNPAYPLEVERRDNSTKGLWVASKKCGNEGRGQRSEVRGQ